MLPETRRRAPQAYGRQRHIDRTADEPHRLTLAFAFDNQLVVHGLRIDECFAQIARAMAVQNYAGYTAVYLSPPISLMVESGLWLLMEAAIGFIVGLGLGSLLGQRTVSVILMIVLEVVLTPLLATARIPYLLNAQRAVLGIATAHLEPNGLTRVFGAGGGPNARSNLVPEATVVAVIVVVAWLVVWTALGAWRMMRRDA